MAPHSTPNIAAWRKPISSQSQLPPPLKMVSSDILHRSFANRHRTEFFNMVGFLIARHYNHLFKHIHVTSFDEVAL